MNENMKYRKIRPERFLFFLLFGVIAFVVVSWVVMFLWNYTLPSVTSIKEITIWQAAALLLLSKILFGSFGRGMRRPRRWERGNRFREKFMNMSEEERQAFKEEMRRRCADRRR